MVDSAATLRVHREFDSFGNIVDEAYFDDEGDPLAAGWFGYESLAFGFTGRAFDETTHLQNNLDRWYDASIGRWMSEDPIGYWAGDANLYRYVGNSPLNWIDPTGNKIQEPCPPNEEPGEDEVKDGLKKIAKGAWKDIRRHMEDGTEGIKDAAEDIAERIRYGKKPPKIILPPDLRQGPANPDIRSRRRSPWEFRWDWWKVRPKEDDPGKGSIGGKIEIGIG